MSGAPALKVAIVEDQHRVREGLRILIDGSEGYVCTGVFGTMEEALEKVGHDLPDLILVDIGLPRMSGIEGIRLLCEKHPRLVVVVLTVYDDDQRIFDAICAGACGYLLKKTPPARLLESLREAMNGGGPMSPEVARRVITLFREAHAQRNTASDLTPHEVRILKLMVEGHNYNSAGAELDVSINTIRFHMRSIYEKLHVHSKSQAISKALRSGIIR
jgi:DNA-binding NarL/FixJ family response regulator